MVKHNEETKHPLALSFSDLSFWCYECNNYVESSKFKAFTKAIYAEKFGEASEMDAVQQLEKEFAEKLNLNPDKQSQKEEAESTAPPSEAEEEVKEGYSFEKLGADLKEGRCRPRVT